MKLLKVIVALGLAVASFGKVAAQQPCKVNQFCTDVCSAPADEIRFVGNDDNAPLIVLHFDDQGQFVGGDGYVYNWYQEIARRIGRTLTFVDVANSVGVATGRICAGEADLYLGNVSITPARLDILAWLMTNAYRSDSIGLVAPGVTPSTSISDFRLNFIATYGREPIFMGGGLGTQQRQLLVNAGVPQDKILNFLDFPDVIATAETQAEAFIRPGDQPDPLNGKLYDAYFVNGQTTNFPPNVPEDCRVNANVELQKAAAALVPPLVVGISPQIQELRFRSLGAGQAINPNCCDLLFQMQCALDSMIADGTYAAIFNAAINNPDLNPDPDLACQLLPNSNAVLPPALHASADNGFFPGCESTLNCAAENVLRMGTCVGDKPWEFLQNGRLVGFDVDVAVAISKVLGKKLIITNYPKSQLIPGILNNSFDIALSHIAIDDATLSEVALVQYNGDALSATSELVGAALNTDCCQLYADVKAAVLKLQENGTLAALRAKWNVPSTFVFKDFTPANCLGTLPNLPKVSCLEQILLERAGCTGQLFQYNPTPGVAGLCSSFYS